MYLVDNIAHNKERNNESYNASLVQYIMVKFTIQWQDTTERHGIKRRGHRDWEIEIFSLRLHWKELSIQSPH